MHGFMIALAATGGVLGSLLAAGTITSVVNGCMTYYHVSAETQGKVNRVIDLISFLARKESPQTFKAIGVPSKSPIETVQIIHTQATPADAVIIKELK